MAYVIWDSMCVPHFRGSYISSKEARSIPLTDTSVILSMADKNVAEVIITDKLPIDARIMWWGIKAKTFVVHEIWRESGIPRKRTYRRI